jgi:hypothetical protein
LEVNDHILFLGNKIIYNITLKYFLFQKVNDIYKQVLQNPELVLQNIVERSITSKDQVTIYTEVYMHIILDLIEAVMVVMVW